MAIFSETQLHSADRPAVAGGSLAWLVRRRVIISLLLFTSLVLLDMFVLAVRPRDIFDWRDPGTVLGELLVLLGLAIRSWAAGTLAKCKSLIRTGPYAVVRNPLYVGSFLMMFGFCTLVHDWQTIWFVVGPIAALYWLAVRHEEAKLAELFPHDWPAYAAGTPRFVPLRWPAAAWRGWSGALWLRNREYRALLWSAISLAGLVAWRGLAA
ncbi:MAG TPA: methyltransferase [Pirellulaceae bacterium]|nr:methyltransferase [Pirellulaceae bacterium]